MTASTQRAVERKEKMHFEADGAKNSRRDDTCKRRLLFAAALMMILVLSNSGDQLPRVFGHVPYMTFQAWAYQAPNIDGNIETDPAWDSAASSIPKGAYADPPWDFELEIGGNTYTGTFYVMNDVHDLYIAVKISDIAPNLGDLLLVIFDNNNDGSQTPAADPVNDDVISLTGGGTFFDLSWDDAGLGGQDPVGSREGEGASFQVPGGFSYYELRHPLDSNDNANDFSLSAGQTVGFEIAYLDNDVPGSGGWPQALPADNPAVWGDIVVASSPPSPMTGAWGSPSIDGSFDAGEWDAASHVPITAGWDYTGDLWIMNDAENLYLAVRITDTNLQDEDSVWFGFDNNNDGTYQLGEDFLMLTKGPAGACVACGFSDGFFKPDPAPGAPALDHNFAGTAEGDGMASAAGGNIYFELEHPLNSADNDHDFSLSAGQTVGFTVGYLDGGTLWYGYWPVCPAAPLANYWLDYTIATPANIAPGAPVNPLCGGETNPTDLTTLTPTLSWTFSDPDSGDTQGAYQIQVSTEANGGGTMMWDTTKVTGDSASVAYGAVGTAAALANDVTYHWRVKTWDNQDAEGAWCDDQTFMIPSVTPTQYTLTLQANPAAGGSVSATPPSPSGLYDAGSTVTITATPASGYSFSSWTGSGTGMPYTGTENPKTITMDGDITETANFAQCGPCAPCVAYGSPAAPEVLYMRYVRDQQIGSTSAGGVLRDGWNTFYYTWSPPLAYAIAGSELSRGVFRVLFVPLLGIVYLAAATFGALSWAGDIASIVAFAVAAILSVTTYIIAPVLALRAAVKWRRRKA